MKKSKRKKTVKAARPGTRRLRKGPKGKAKAGTRARRRTVRRRRPDSGGGEETLTPSLQTRLSHPDTTPTLSGGDVDADWQRAESSGEEAVGGSVATPDQDVVDEIGRALGVEQGATAPLITSGEILRDRDQRRWELERRADRRRKGQR